MKKIVFFPGLDGTGDLYAPLIDELTDTECYVLIYPEDLTQPVKIASYLLANYEFEQYDHCVAESFGCLVLIELLKQSKDLTQANLFLAGFDSIHSHYKLALNAPDFALRLLYKKAANKLVLNTFCLGNTKDKELLDMLVETLRSLPYETAIGRARFLAGFQLPVSEGKYNKAKFVLSENDKLLSKKQQKQFADKYGIQDIIELASPHFVAQTQPKAVAKIIRQL